MIRKDIYCKLDNGSQSSWQPWNGTCIQHDSLYSCAEAYIHAVYEEGKWTLKYRPFCSKVAFPSFVGKQLSEKEAILAIDQFADWVLNNRRMLVAEMESYES